MRALISREAGGPETLEFVELPEPVVGEGELVVRVLACAINYPDVLIIQDKYQFKPPRPFSPGGEISGVVEVVGPGVTGWKAGDRLICAQTCGGLAERIAIPAKSAFPLPPEFDPIKGSALLLTYATTMHALVDRAQLRRGETMLVLGAAGGIGLSAIEIGKAMGARVVAAVSDETKGKVAREAGADSVVVYPRGPFDRDSLKTLASLFKEAVGTDGANVIFDPVGGDYCEASLRAIAWEGRYLVIGFPAGIPRLPLNLALLKSCDVRGVFWGGFRQREPERDHAHVQQLLNWWREDKIRPRIGRTWPLEEAGEAIAWLGERQAIGKAVVTIGL